MPETLAGRFLQWDGFPFPFHEPWFEFRRRVARVLRDRWEDVCRDAIGSGKLQELHEARGDIQAIFDGYLGLFKDYAGLIDLSERLTGRNGRFGHVREDVARATDELVRLRDDIFPRWKTVEDLAAMLIEKIDLPPEQQKALATAYPPPESWYDDDFDPFTTDTPE